MLTCRTTCVCSRSALAAKHSRPSHVPVTCGTSPFQTARTQEHVGRAAEPAGAAPPPYAHAAHRTRWTSLGGLPVCLPTVNFVGVGSGFPVANKNGVRGPKMLLEASLSRETSCGPGTPQLRLARVRRGRPPGNHEHAVRWNTRWLSAYDRAGLWRHPRRDIGPPTLGTARALASLDSKPRQPRPGKGPAPMQLHHRHILSLSVFAGRAYSVILLAMGLIFFARSTRFSR
jgi:hypothetical protein